jgi:hypothetical protein
MHSTTDLAMYPAQLWCMLLLPLLLPLPLPLPLSVVMAATVAIWQVPAGLSFYSCNNAAF